MSKRVLSLLTVLIIITGMLAACTQPAPAPAPTQAPCGPGAGTDHEVPPTAAPEPTKAPDPHCEFRAHCRARTDQSA